MSAECLITFVLRFARELRNHGMKVTPTDSVDAIKALGLFENLNKKKIYAILRLVFVKKFEDYEIFDMVFNKLYNRIIEDIENEETLDNLEILDKESPLNAVENNENDTKFNFRVMYSPYEFQSKRNLRNSKYIDVINLRKSLKSLAKIMATYRGLRYRNEIEGYIDMRKTYRKNIAYGGEILYLMRKNRKQDRAKIVLVCDISASMDNYTEKVFALMFCVANKFHRSSVFCFSTNLVNVDIYLKGYSFEKAKDILSNKVDIWKSGTRIGFALNSLIKNYSGILDRKTILIIVSDGLDLGDIEILKNSLEEIRRKVKNIIWLNPLADEKDYKPYALGMKTALDFIDVFVPFSDLWKENKLRKEIIKQLCNTRNKNFLFNLTSLQ
jgi:uncharacterized protein with von Willebrand factor type A (vWA) domain